MNANGKKNRLRGGVWLHFEPIPGSAKKAICNYCKNPISYLTTTNNLKSHLNKKHFKEFTKETSTQKKVDIEDNDFAGNCEFVSLAKVEPDPEPDQYLDSDCSSGSNHEPPPASPEAASLSKNAQSKKRACVIWEYFVGDKSKVAMCNKCNAAISYKSTISNLKEHLRRKHPSLFSKYLKQRNLAENEMFFTKNEDFNFSMSDNKDDPLTNETNGDVVWDYFQREENSDKYAVCILCYSHQPVNFLKEHLRKKHTTTFNQLYENNLVEYEVVGIQSSNPINQMSTIEIIDPAVIEQEKTKKRKVSTFSSPNENKIANDSIISLFTTDLQPFSIVEDKGFIAFVKSLNPLYNLPVKEDIYARIIPSLYDKSLNNMKTVVINAAKSVCLTIEHWSSLDEENFMALSSHFVTDDFEFKSVYMDTVNISNSPNLALIIKNVTEEWKLGDKVSLVVTDDSPSLNNAILELGWQSCPCYAHTLNIVVQEAVMLLEDVFEKIRMYVQYFSTNKEAAKRLFHCQLEAKTESIELKELISCISCKWVSIYYMVERFVYLENPIQAVCDDNEDLPLFSEEEWAACKQLCRLLKPFVEVTKKMSEEKYMSGSSAIVLTTCLLRAMRNFDSDDAIEGVAKEIHYKLKTGLMEKFQTLETNEALAICTFLDPRFKVHGFSRLDGSGGTISSNAQRIKRRVTDIVESMINIKTPTTTSITTSDRKCNSFTDDYSIWDEFDKVVSNVATTGSFLSNAIQEIEMYLNDDILPRNGNPLEWWNSHRFVYPNLSKLYIEKCNVVASSLPCQWLFSEEGFIMESRRARLQSSHREVLFLNGNQ